jgi:hypothetical protein
MPSYTTEFQPIPAASVIVRGLSSPPATMDCPTQAAILSSLPGVFSVSGDTARLIGSLAADDVPLLRAA